MKTVIAAVAAALAVSTDIAARIVAENDETLRMRDLPPNVEAFGYATPYGSDLMLTVGNAVVCPLRISATTLDEIECERRGTTPHETPMTARERRIAQRLVSAMAASDGGAMLHHDGTWLAVDGQFRMADIVRAVVSEVENTAAMSIA